MKKALLIAILFVSVVFLSACHRTKATEPTDETMVITVINNADFDIYMIEINTGYVMGGMGYADGSKIRRGDLLNYVYVDGKDLNLKGDERIDFSVIGAEKKSIYLGKAILTLKPNTHYFLEVRGKTEEDAYFTVREGVK